LTLTLTDTNLAGTRYRIIVSCITNEEITVMLYANSIASALGNNKFKSLETPTRTGTVSVNCTL